MLDLAIAQALYERFPEFSEGRLTKAWAYVVSRTSCAEVGKLLRLGERLGEGVGAPAGPEVEKLGRNRNVLAALVESSLGALYLEYGFERIRGAIVRSFAERIEYAVTTHVDYKTELQEEIARLGTRHLLRRGRDAGTAPRAHLHLRRADRRRGGGHRHGELQEGRRAGGGPRGASEAQRLSGSRRPESRSRAADPLGAGRIIRPAVTRCG